MIGLIFAKPSDVWNRSASLFAQKYAASFNHLYSAASADSADKQVKHIDRLIDELGCSVMVLQSQGLTAQDVDQALIRRGIPVILLEQKIEIDYDFFITGDNTGAGQLIGEHIASILEGSLNPQDTVLVLEAVDSWRGALRAEACIAALNEAGITNIKRYPVASFSKAAGKKAMEAVLKISDSLDYSSCFRAVYALDDAAAEGVCEAVIGRKKKNLNISAICGCGGLRPFLNRMIADTVDISLLSAYYPSVMSQECVRVARMLLRGETPESRDVLVESFLIDKSNAENYLDESLVL